VVDNESIFAWRKQLGQPNILEVGGRFVLKISGTFSKNVVGFNRWTYRQLSSQSRNGLPLIFQRHFRPQQFISQFAVFLVLAL